MGIDLICQETPYKSRQTESRLHSETKVLPVSDHLNMLSAKYLASALRPDHPANEPVRRLARHRDNKFDSNNDASNECENERIFPNLLEFT